MRDAWREGQRSSTTSTSRSRGTRSVRWAGLRGCESFAGLRSGLSCNRGPQASWPASRDASGNPIAGQRHANELGTWLRGQAIRQSLGAGQEACGPRCTNTRAASLTASKPGAPASLPRHLQLALELAEDLHGALVGDPDPDHLAAGDLLHVVLRRPEGFGAFHA